MNRRSFRIALLPVCSINLQRPDLLEDSAAAFKEVQCHVCKSDVYSSTDLRHPVNGKHRNLQLCRCNA